MISKRLARFAAVAVLAFSTVVMMTASFDAEARRMGGGKSFGRQSSNVMQQRQAVQPPAATNRSATPANANAARSGAAAQPKSGFSRFLGPIAGIAAGLGIAALLSSLGLGGALLEALSSAVLIALVVFAVIFVVRRLRGGSARPATQSAGQASPMYRDSTPQMPANASAQNASFQAEPMADLGTATEPVQAIDPSWFIPADFDITSFLNNSKQQFRHIQELWDQGNPAALSEYLTDDLLKELTPEILAREGAQHTQIVLLNAELLGIEKVTDGHLASVRYSGMLREDPNSEAFSFEEVWNLYKADNTGWLLAGIQQIDTNN
ncbi:Tim44 domain-containing protein [Paenalcaligenes hominis]|uniref:Lipid-binding transport protein (Tim44 family) n=1 Tax=Paenalcaligenes hominis TaxID=643674 RepID=A0ABX0WNW9_9BURK|nr:TIM44-like domain-containing protein [Paenalcaligenes hominis]NJB64974.1 putative lipid-binding transport protein (Tim44 family) [Paenalcaligenes hominis]GGE57667.1 membrane protein [Paenalcaligenes hominis]